jgi:hypothetical protein
MKLQPHSPLRIALAGALVVAATAAYPLAVYRCQMTGAVTIAPCCDHESPGDERVPAQVRARPCCESLWVSADRSPSEVRSHESGSSFSPLAFVSSPLPLTHLASSVPLAWTRAALDAGPPIPAGFSILII